MNDLIAVDKDSAVAEVEDARARVDPLLTRLAGQVVRDHYVALALEVLG
jgi:hypothetical protein